MFTFNPTQSPNQTTNPLKHLFDTIFSYDGNVMLAALVSLLLVILFVLLLHVYAKWFLAQAHHRRRGSIAVSRRVLGPNRFQHFHTFNFDPSTNTPKGLEVSTIASLPLFVYKAEEEHSQQHLVCVICLTPFEDDEVGRSLPKCGHCFHVECIDMWLHSHTSCPICRAPVVAPAQSDQPKPDLLAEDSAAEAVVIEVSDSGYVENHHHHEVVEETNNDSSSDESSSSPLMVVGCSLKRMLSRNRPESKVFPSTNGNDMNVC